MKTRDLLRCALFAALTAAGAIVRIPLLHTTVTLQFFFTIMAGLLLGAKRGALSQAVYVALGLVGLPVFASGGGFGYLFEPTCGFVLGLIPAAWVIGAVSAHSHSAVRIALACAAGLAALYAVGLPYIALIVNGYLGGAIRMGYLLAAYMLPYLPFDCLKIAAAVVIAPRILRAMAYDF